MQQNLTNQLMEKQGGKNSIIENITEKIKELIIDDLNNIINKEFEISFNKSIKKIGLIEFIDNQHDINNENASKFNSL